MIDVSIPAEFEPFVQHAVQSGEFRSPAEVVAEGLRLLTKRDQVRKEIQVGLDQLDGGEGIDGEEVLDRLQRKAEQIARAAVAAQPSETNG